MQKTQPFRIDVADETLQRIRAKVAQYPWHEMPDDGGWGYGTNLDYLKEFCAYWLEQYDWRKHEADLNRFAHYRTEVDGIDLHWDRSSSSTTSLNRWRIPSASAAVSMTPSR